MAGGGALVLKPWIRELILGAEFLSSPRAGQLLKVLQDAETPGPSRAPNASYSEAMLLVSDGTHSVRCLVTREALDASDWEEKEFGFLGTEGRLLLLQDCQVCVQVSEGTAPSEFYLQVNRFSLLPLEQPRAPVIDCNQDSAVQRKLCDCLADHLSESTPSSTGLTLTQLLEEVQEDQEHRVGLVRLAESCLVLADPCPTPPLSHWAAARCGATEGVVYSVPSHLLHISENDLQMLKLLGLGQRPQDPELPPSEPAPLDTSPSLLSCAAPGTPVLPGPTLLSQEIEAGPSLQPAMSTPDSAQGISCQLSPAPCSALSNYTPSPIPLNSIPSLSPLSRGPHLHQAHATKARKPSLEFKELGLSCKNQQPSLRAEASTGTQEVHPAWDPPTKHRDGSSFQYKYQLPCTSLCTQLQAIRLPPQLIAWALHLVMESHTESELTQV
ncbi:adrenocortical dysplasia protein homolog isoform X2 [Ochotona curzoniae]|uniref:adrenocortical dysplasia protein homolog isoform X2 n=1 Tax=Ochotona curzoniae TaxID=130825 RepID=UPI001B34CAB0|nr:adrenocortical dysplasia protein homolog isoform X2 [Ochotona curzoniae]XP_040853202.1 adrenocortical dysplasia protein homolog isoform X2 [Ochotona curzoniae]